MVPGGDAISRIAPKEQIYTDVRPRVVAQGNNQGEKNQAKTQPLAIIYESYTPENTH